MVKENTSPFTPAVKKRLEKARERLDYRPYGVISAIADEVGVKRQYVHSVIRDPDTFDKHYGDTARKIWFCLERRLDEDTQLSRVESIVKSLKEDKPIEVKMDARFYSFLVRRLNRLGIVFMVTDNGEAPATYTFTPKPKSQTD
jgi:hypothetical protein